MQKSQWDRNNRVLLYLVLIAEIPEKAKRQRIGKKSKEKQNQKRAADRHWLG